MNNIIFASVISDLQQSPMFMTVKAIICDTPEANLNGAKVTEAFVNEVVKNQKRYVGLPLYADIKALLNGSYNRLGHLYDVKTGEFHSTQIGSFFKFEKEEFEKGHHLIGYARIPKRNQKLSNAIAELFAQGRLKFSFEVSVGEYDENDDGTITIDASENNYLEGTAIVTYPACEDAVALELVAQRADAQEGGEQEMHTQKQTAEQEVLETKEAVEEKVVAEEATEIAAEEKAETEEHTEASIAEEERSETKETAEETPVQAEENKETAEVYVVESTTEKHEVHAYDSATGKAIHQEVKVETTTENSIEGTLVEADDGTHVAEAKETAESSDNSGVIAEAGDSEGDSGDTSGDADATETPVENPNTDPVVVGPGGTQTEDTTEEIEDPTPDSYDSKKKTAEQMIAELAEVVESLRKEIAEIKETKVVAQKMTAEINPLMADIKPQKTYSLLEKAERNTDYRSLLEKY